ncbi:Helix-turn-helix domain protein [Actinoalloteichus hoggarensis]|uniref:Helix-turn-helix domain protein n=1 Tax=Actinoalloteichus hoggarensis TaxID=1470176 RepID=A0A221W8F8_9PSEU|nr:Helix-turn-helix domain protein [Actinoalloteichus hoggarensis]
MRARRSTEPAPLFFTVRETAEILRVDTATIYRAIREDAFPSVKVRTRYVVPVAALEELIDEAAEHGGCVDVAAMATRRRQERDVARALGGGLR